MVAALAAPVDRLSAEVIGFESLDAGEGLVAIRSGVPDTFWNNVPGVLSVGAGSAVFPKGGLPDDPTFREQWNLERIEAAGAWNYTTGGFTPSGRQIVIGVIEANGFDLEHPELVDQYYRNPGEIPGNGVDDDRNGYVDDVTGVNFTARTTTFQRHPHGVQVSGVLAAKGNNGAQSTGLNWRAKLLPFQVDSVYKWAVALDYLTTLRRRYNETSGAEGAYVVVVNCSLGNNATCTSPVNAELNAAIDRAGRAGILVVGAVGNDTGDADRNSDIPASCASDFLITVTSADKSDVVLAGAGYSRTQVDISAPGDPFGGLKYSANVDFNTFGQTSGATPQVAGTVALMYAALCERLEALSLAEPEQVAALMKELVLRSADAISSQTTRVSSGGRLNAARAMAALQLESACSGNGFVVGFDAGTPAPQVLPTVNGPLRLVDTLSIAWDLYRYSAGSLVDIPVDLVRASPPVALAVSDTRLVSEGRDYGFGGGRDYLDEIGQPGAEDIVAAGNGGSLLGRNVAAVFELGYGESPTEVLGPILNPFAPPLGLSGDALSGITQEVSGEPRSRTTLRQQGYRLGDWVAAADRAVTARQAYETSAGATGLRVVTFATSLSGMLSDRGTASPTSVTELVLHNLLEAGIIPVLPPSDAELGSRAAQLPTGGLIAEPIGAANVSEPYATLLAPSRDVAFGTDDSSCRVTGALAAVAQVAGSVVLLSEFECPSARNLTPAMAAIALSAALLGTDPSTQPRVSLDLVPAARLNSARCSEEATANPMFLSVFPNPVGPQRRVRLIYAITEPGDVDVFDMAGRRLAGQKIALPFGGFGQVGLELGDLAPGVYVLRMKSGTRVESTQIVLQ